MNYLKRVVMLLLLTVFTDKMYSQTLTGAEYFFNTDPGVGKAIPFNISFGDTVNATFNIPSTGIPAGFNQLFIRFKNNLNQWGIAEQRAFYIDNFIKTIPAKITTGEYFFTTDTGVGKGQPLIFNKTDSLNKVFKTVVPALSLGTQYLEMRVKDSLGKWSVAESRTIEIVCKPNLGNNSSVTICPGSTTDITSLYDYINYASWQWSTTNPSSVGPGTYRLIVTSSLGCSDTAVVTVSINKPNLGNDTIVSKCAGTAVNLAVLYNTTGLTVQWNTPDPQNVVAPGIYTLIAVNATGCSDTARVTVNDLPLPTPTITSSGSTSNVCPGKTVTLDAGAYSSYLWSTGATTRTIVVTAAGNYSVTVANTSGCSAASPVTSVTYQGCAKPANLAVTNITATSARFGWAAVNCAAGYQLQYRKTGTSVWTTVQQTGISKNITGLTAVTTYEWRVQTGCVVTNPIIASGYITGPNFTTAASISISSHNISGLNTGSNLLNAILFPNPAASNTTLKITGNVNTLNITIADVAGKVLWRSWNVKDTQINLPVEKLTAGVYIVNVTDGKENRIIKLVKE